MKAFTRQIRDTTRQNWQENSTILCPDFNPCHGLAFAAQHQTDTHAKLGKELGKEYREVFFHRFVPLAASKYFFDH